MKALLLVSALSCITLEGMEKSELLYDNYYTVGQQTASQVVANFKTLLTNETSFNKEEINKTISYFFSPIKVLTKELVAHEWTFGSYDYFEDLQKFYLGASVMFDSSQFDSTLECAPDSLNKRSIMNNYSDLISTILIYLEASSYDQACKLQESALKSIPSESSLDRSN